MNKKAAFILSSISVAFSGYALFGTMFLLNREPGWWIAVVIGVFAWCWWDWFMLVRSFTRRPGNIDLADIPRQVRAHVDLAWQRGDLFEWDDGTLVYIGNYVGWPDYHPHELKRLVGRELRTDWTRQDDHRKTTMMSLSPTA